MIDKLYYPMAIKMARKGASRGMVVHRLRQEGITLAMATEIADAAYVSVAARTRLKGALQCLLGLGVLGAAGVVYGLMAHPRIPIMLGMYGVIIAGIGVANVSHRFAQIESRTPVA